MTADFASIKRVILGGLLLYVLWLLAGNVFGFGVMMKRQQQEQQQTIRTIEQNGEQQTRLLRENTEALARRNRERQDLARQNIARLQTGGRPKLTASALADHLRRVNAFGLAADPQRRLSCAESQGEWDYTCRFHPDPITASSWVQFGVLVDDGHVREISKTCATGVSLPPPLNQAVR